MVAYVGLLVPFLFLALTRYLDGSAGFNLTGLYATLVFLGYYLLILLFVLTVVFLLLVAWPRIALAVCGMLAGGALFYLVIDSIIYRVYRYHIDAFWIDYAFQSFSGIGVSGSMLGLGLAILGVVAALQVGLFKLAGRIRARGRLAAVVAAVALVAYAASQSMHVLAYERNDTRFTDMTLRLPFYYPITSHRHALRYANMLPGIAERPGVDDDASRLALTYPLHPVDCDSTRAARRPNILLILLESWRGDTMTETITPHMYALARRGSVFEDHFSSGNSTPSGVFSIFYGIHPTYWAAVKANSASINNPVLIDVLQANGYEFGIFADSHFDRHKIKDGMFRGITVHEDFEGASTDQKDRDLTEKLYRFAAESDAAGRPFFGFAFYKSTHFSYFYPRDSARFTPASKLNIALARGNKNPEAFFNDYKNSVSYVDELVGGLIERLDADGILENTIVVITSDHGEEFDDNKANYWGHTSNFTGYQTHVPLIIYVPWKQPQVVTQTTAHVDIPPTLLQEGLGCTQDVGDYSNGYNLFHLPNRKRAVVISSYINHAIVTNDDVYSIFPMYIQKYKLWNINAKADAMPPDLARDALDGMNRFFRGNPPS
ncbi:MAG TPA: sulfatase-like hydrolase/transferase [Candidatus Krumholzibacteria bacterium]|nr:sulfatase-like hydrolase/transferase [Candidatus Krumholzibacteria bacterium]